MQIIDILSPAAIFFIVPSHAAEQQNKERNNDSAERSDFPKRPPFMSSAGDSAESGTSDWLSFLLVRFLWTGKENEQLYEIEIRLVSSSFACPKEEARKGHPNCPGLSDCPALLVVDGTLKTRLRLKQVQRLVPSTTAMLSGPERGHKKTFF